MSRVARPQRIAQLRGVLELGEVLLVELDVRRGHVLLEVLHGAGTGNQQHPLVAGEQPGERDLRGGDSVPLRDPSDGRIVRQLLGAAAERRTEREVGHKCDLSLHAHLEHVFAGAVDDAVGVLDFSDVDQVEARVGRRRHWPR